MTEKPKITREDEAAHDFVENPDRAWGQALEIEEMGQKVSDTVKKGLFMSAAKYEALREAAYRRGLEQGTDVLKWREQMGMNIEYDSDDWNHGPNFR